MEDKNYKLVSLAVDKFIPKGIPIGELSVFYGNANPKTNLIQFLPTVESGDKSYRIMMSLEQSEEQLKESVCLIYEMLKKLKDDGFDFSKSVHKSDNIVIGNVIFPIQYYNNGIVTVDYPNQR